MMIEIVIPLRNPPEAFRRTIESLATQTDRQFSVLVSDNHSTVGRELIDEAKTRLAAAGIVFQVLRPPRELGRVQHWNWAHHASVAAWLKPLFAGDWLEPDCIAECKSKIEANPTITFFTFYFRYHRGEEVDDFDCLKLSGLIPMETAALLSVSHGNFMGAPVNVLYRRDAFEAAGGHNTALPFTADFDLYRRLANDGVLYVIPKFLGNFWLHEARFTKKRSGYHREDMTYELTLNACLAVYSQVCAGRPLPEQRIIPKLLKLSWHSFKVWFSRWGGHVWRWIRKKH